MKKTIYSLGVIAAAAISLVSCQKEISAPDENPVVKGTPFEIIATSADTKTVNNGLETEWAGSESINLFYAAAGTSEYNNGGEFKTTESGASVKFNGTIDATKLGDSNDWYAFYPYTSQITSPSNVSSGWVAVGGRTDASQQQKGPDSKEHLAGNNLPMYAIANGVEKGTTPELSFNHLASVIKVHVTNSTSESVAVSSVSFTAPEDIVGTYYIDFSTATPKYTASDAKYVSNTANLNVTDAEITAGASADFYLAIKPFTAKSGDKLSLAVNGQTKEITLSKDFTFTAGHIKPLNFNYIEQEIIDYVTLPWTEDFSGDLSLYTLVNGKSETKIYQANLAGGVVPELLVNCQNGSFSAKIKAEAGEYILQFKSNHPEVLIISTDVETIILNKIFESTEDKRAEYSISIPDGVEFFNITFKNTDSKTNSRLDDVSLVRQLPQLETPEIEVTKNADDPYTIDVDWLDVDNATSYVVTCTGQTDQTIDRGVMAASFSGLTDGDYVVTVTAMAERYKSATATSDSIHIGLASRNLTFADATKTIAFRETYTNVLTGAKTDDVTYSITHSNGSAVTEDEITLDTKTGDVLAGDIAGEYTITATAPATAEYAAGTASYTLIVKEAGQGGEAELLTTKLTNAELTAGTGSTSYGNCKATDSNNYEYSAYAIFNSHSKATAENYFWQIKKYASGIAYYVKLPEFPGTIQSIKLTVSNASKPMNGGGNTATLYFSNSNSTTTTGSGVVNGTGASTITIDASSLDLKTGYITSGGAVRIWDIEIQYYSK